MRHAPLVFVTACLAALSGPLSARAADEKPGHGASREPVLFSADEVQYDQDLGLTVAKGDVEISQGQEILLADTVTYNQRTDTVTASGHVSLLQPTGDIVFADYMELQNDMRDGFIKDVRLLLTDRSRLAGNTARRIDGTRTELRRGVYSPCELCKDDPTRPPVWQIKAEEITHDKELQIVEYRDAVMEIDGIPVFYSPYFSHPDPSVKRASGFLPPTIGDSNTLGFHTTLPYYWAIAPDKDATFRPILTTSAGDVLGGEYRQRFDNGELLTNGSIAFFSPPQSANTDNFGPATQRIRGDLFSTGIFDIDPNWRVGYDIQRESDQTYMLRYELPTPPTLTDVVRTTNYLTSRLYAENFGVNSYTNIAAYSFQSLNPLIGDSTSAFVAPAASYDWTSDPDEIGGRFHFNGNFLNLERLTEPEIRRVSTGGQWSLPFNGAFGDHFSFTASLRTDGYDSDHVPLTPYPTESSIYGNAILPSNMGTTSAWAGRVFPQASLKWNYPWVRTTADGNALIEPIVALIASPNGGNPSTIYNEDSQAYEFDDTSLFVPNRFPGYDRVDSGQRVDYGLHGEYNSNTYGNWETLIGQSYRAENNSAFDVGSGVEDRESDIVGRISATPRSYLDFIYRFRLDKDDFAIRRQEATVDFGPPILRTSLSYISIAAVPGVSTSQTGDQINASIAAELTRYWSLALTDTRDIGSSGATIRAGLAATYRDDCLAVITSVTQSGISIGDVRPGLSFMVTFVFKNLGEIGERFLSTNSP